MNGQDALDRLAELFGILPEYTDIWGQRHAVSQETKKALLGAMGLPVEDERRQAETLAMEEKKQWTRPLPPVIVERETAFPLRFPVSLPESALGGALSWKLFREDAGETGGTLRPGDLEETGRAVFDGVSYSRRVFILGGSPGLGYHTLEITGGGVSAAMRLIVAPETCYTPPALEGEGRVWGPMAQLYSLRSRRNWGIGDYTDLRNLVDQAGGLGADIVGVNPLHSLFPHNPNACSPYGPSSRMFLNVLYLDVEAIAEFGGCQEARRMTRATDFQSRLRAVRRGDLVDYAAVMALKKPVLEALFREFAKRRLSPEDERGREFRRFQAEGGEALYRHALFEALQESFHDEDESVWGWPVWPEEYRSPSSQAVARFAEQRRGRVEFYQYLQWQARLQLEAVGRASMESRLGVGLFQDLAVSVDRGGAEAWANQDIYATGAGVGAPPDDFNLNGQDWGLPPMIPARLKEAAYEPFIATLRSNMASSGALRVDHVMGLMRLFWIPPGGKPADGAYVAYPFGDLMGILALESRRRECLIVGEDLGTVPVEVREAMDQAGALSYRLFYFEKDGEGAFKQPGDYPEKAVAAVTTHDLPTLAGYWEGRDLAVRSELDLFPAIEQRENQTVERARERARLLVALEREGLLPEGMDLDPGATPRMTPELALAVHAYLARTPSKVALTQLEDLFGSRDQVNMPGAVEGYPNWRRRIKVYLEDFPDDERTAQTAAMFVREGRKPRPAPEPPKAVIPRAVYRLQMSRDFTFASAAELLPYLDSLGASHVYMSPVLKARPGSAHGYDVVDHDSLNPEIGSREDFSRLADALEERGMGLILDIVPNHMGVMGADNAWWLDTLENGQASLYADFFDIDWSPVKQELRGKILVPVLAEHYGALLEKGALKLVFDAEEGSFSVFYHEHRFPIDPREYPRILYRRMETLAARLGEDSGLLEQFQSLVTALSKLPDRSASGRRMRDERSRDKEIHKKRLAGLAASSPEIRAHVEESVAELNGNPGEPDSFRGLHHLLEAQAWRLAYWRVAADEINYRRFFDINDLAGLRTENEKVFDATHGLMLEFVRSGGVHGLRIDHPDGLYDPLGYLRLLLGKAAAALTEGRTGGREEVMPVYLVVEKILASYERLPEDWPIHGTTGYEFACALNGLFVDPASEKALSRVYNRFTGEKRALEEVIYQSKKTVMRMSMASELNVLANQLSRLSEMDWKTRDFTLNGLRDALAELVACFPVYRTYVTEDGASDSDKSYVDWAAAQAVKRNPGADATVYGFIRDTLLLNLPEGAGDEYKKSAVRFAMRFQQYTAPVMAKGVEDTAFYRYNRLVSLNEVGADPGRLGSSPASFHRAMQERARSWPHALSLLSSHDTKRGEDARARINVLSETPEEWGRALTRFKRLNRAKKTRLDGRPAPSADDEYLFYQALLGAWPPGEADEKRLASLRERMKGYMLKAAREAKTATSWANPSAEYEAALESFIDAALAPEDKNPFLREFLPFQRRVSRLGFFNSLSQTLLKLTAPGTPDIYQGCELWNLALVDPDNRGLVDYGKRRAMLERIKGIAALPADALAGEVLGLLDAVEDGGAKMYITFRALSLRRDFYDLFKDGEYIPLAVEGEGEGRLIAFARRLGGSVAIAAVGRFFASLPDPPVGQAAWEGTWIRLPADLGVGNLVNALTGEPLAVEEMWGEPSLAVPAVFKSLPVALLRGDADGKKKT
ncbi:MAG: malto-oligosyltrehalose synthase [Candidatus Nitrospinota bacterium M3_3B_026]